MSEINFNTAV